MGSAAREANRSTRKPLTGRKKRRGGFAFTSEFTSGDGSGRTVKKSLPKMKNAFDARLRVCCYRARTKPNKSRDPLLTMKAISLLLAGIGGAGFLYRSQLQTLMNSPRAGMRDVLQHHQAPEGVYYLRTGYTIPTIDGDVRWSAGQELRVATDTLATHGFLSLTDGTNTMEVPQTAVTRDMDDAVALRQVEASNQRMTLLTAQQDAARQADASRQVQVSQPTSPARLIPGQFHASSLDAPAVSTNRYENIVSTAGGPVMYPTYQTVVIERREQSGPAINRPVVMPPRTTRPVNVPPPVINRSSTGN